ncbi:hypothetical protein DPX16_19251 [Anabarilius grahami]|uniref:Uncharacterized protein n=1 Tax=Anabarilius grahami TaxID=495550 RepID=A0A3N0Z0B7_ANAGA|nr:hypothetical protein DPX16_19251 [Anabarilius grahami]
MAGCRLRPADVAVPAGEATHNGKQRMQGRADGCQFSDGKVAISFQVGKKKLQSESVGRVLSCSFLSWESEDIAGCGQGLPAHMGRSGVPNAHQPEEGAVEAGIERTELAPHGKNVPFFHSPTCLHHNQMLNRKHGTGVIG